MKRSGVAGLSVLLVIILFAAWWLVSLRAPQVGRGTIVYYTEMDGRTEAVWKVSMHPVEPGTSADRRLHDLAQFVATNAVAGPPSDIDAIRFPTGTQVNSLSVNGTIATVDLSPEVQNRPGGSFGEDGEFKSLVYTLTALPGITAVQITIAGVKVATLPRGHLELDQPLRRSDW